MVYIILDSPFCPCIRRRNKQLSQYFLRVYLCVFFYSWRIFWKSQYFPHFPLLLYLSFCIKISNEAFVLIWYVPICVSFFYSSYKSRVEKTTFSLHALETVNSVLCGSILLIRTDIRWVFWKADLHTGWRDCCFRGFGSRRFHCFTTSAYLCVTLCVVAVSRLNPKPQLRVLPTKWYLSYSRAPSWERAPLSLLFRCVCVCGCGCLCVYLFVHVCACLCAHVCMCERV